MKQLDVYVSSPANIIGPRPTFIDMTLTNVTFVLNEILSSSFGLVTDIDALTERKRCTWAHHAVSTGELKNEYALMLQMK